MDVTMMNRVRDVVLGWFAGRDADIKIVNEAFDSLTVGTADHTCLALSTGAKLCVDADYSVHVILPKAADIGELKQETIDSATSDLTAEKKTAVEHAVAHARTDLHCCRFAVPIGDKIIFFDGNNAYRFENVRS